MKMEEENKRRMEELTRLIKEKQEEIDDEIVPGAYFYDTELVNKLREEINQMQEEYNELEEIPTMEKVNADIEDIESKLEEIQEEFNEYSGAYFMTEDMQELEEERKNLLEELEDRKETKEIIEEIEKNEKELESLKEEENEYIGAYFIPKEILEGIKEKEEKIKELEQKLLSKKTKESDLDKGPEDPERPEGPEGPESPEDPEGPEGPKDKKDKKKGDPEEETGSTEPIDPGDDLHPATSGLQIYKKLLNEGPKLRRRDCWGYGRFVTHTSILGKLVGLVAKPFGNKYRKEMYNEIKDLSSEEFEMLTEYLTEEKIVQLKVPMPFLDSLQKRFNEISKIKEKEYKQRSNELKPLLDSAKQERDEIEAQLEDPSLDGTARKAILLNKLDEKKRLIDDYETELGYKGNDGLKQKDATLKDVRKNLRRGANHRSFREQGNYEFFGKRQVDNTESVNELADIELEGLEGRQEMSDVERQMDKYMSEKTNRGKKFGIIPIETGDFYKEDSELTTEVSDRIENRPEMVIYLVLGSYGAIKSAQEILKDKDMMNQLIAGVQGMVSKLSSPKALQAQADSLINDLNSLNGITEYSNAEGAFWDISSGKYVSADTAHHNFFEAFVPGIQNRINNVMSTLAQTDPVQAGIELQNIKLDILDKIPAEALASNVPAHSAVWQGLPQGMQELVASNAALGKDAAMEYNKAIIDVLSQGKNLGLLQKAGKIVADLTGPIVSAITTGARFVDDLVGFSKNKNPQKDKDDNDRA